VAGKLPSIIITGASGFVGRHLLDDLKNEYRIFGMARRSQHECNAPVHANIAWIRADIADYQSISKAFREVVTAGGADYLIHLAAYYDFSGENRPEYKQTNVEGTRHVLELAKDLNLRLFVFVSSVAACSFPREGAVVDEMSPPDGKPVYAWSKRLGEAMVREFSHTHPACIVRMGAVFSDWCEYPPLYMFLNTWLSNSWQTRILAGRGESAIPYIHIRDIVTFYRQVLNNHERLDSADVLVACTSGATSHLELFNLTTRHYYGKARRPVLMPRFLCAIGLWSKNLWGHITGNLPFERPWMRHYIDLKLNVDNSRTCKILDWSPRIRHMIGRRFPFLLERLKSEPFAWSVRNLAAMRRDSARPGLRIYTALLDTEDEIVNSVVEHVTTSDTAAWYPHLRGLDREELTWFVRLIYRLLLTSVDTGNRMSLLNYFEISGMSRFEAGFTANEIVRLLTQLNDEIIGRLEKVEKLSPFEREIYDSVSMPIEFGKDEIEQQYELFLQDVGDRVRKDKSSVSEITRSAREQLEDTIWSCLKHRR